MAIQKIVYFIVKGQIGNIKLANDIHLEKAQFKGRRGLNKTTFFKMKIILVHLFITINFSCTSLKMYVHLTLKILNEADLH